MAREINLPFEVAHGKEGGGISFAKNLSVRMQ